MRDLPYSNALVNYIVINQPILGNDDRLESFAVIAIPVVKCGANGPGHLPHRSQRYDLPKHLTASHLNEWTWCPGDDIK